MKQRPISQSASRMGTVLLLWLILIAVFSPISNWIDQNACYFLSIPLIYALRLLAFLLPAWLLLGPLPKQPEPLRPSGPKNHWIAWSVLGYGVCLLVTTIGLFFGLGGLTFRTLVQNQPPDILSHLWILVPAALWEEFMFRRFYCAYLIPYGRTFAILFSAYLFAVFHWNLPQALYAFPFGILTGYLYLKTGTITLPFLIHLLDNFLFQQFFRLHELLLAWTGLSYGQGFFLCSLLLILAPLVYLCLRAKKERGPSLILQIQQIVRRITAQKADYKAAFSSGGMLLVHAWFIISCFVAVTFIANLNQG